MRTGLCANRFGSFILQATVVAGPRRRAAPGDRVPRPYGGDEELPGRRRRDADRQVAAVAEELGRGQRADQAGADDTLREPEPLHGDDGAGARPARRRHLGGRGGDGEGHLRLDRGQQGAPGGDRHPAAGRRRGGRGVDAGGRDRPGARRPGHAAGGVDEGRAELRARAGDQGLRRAGDGDCGRLRGPDAQRDRGGALGGGVGAAALRRRVREGVGPGEPAPGVYTAVVPCSETLPRAGCETIAYCTGLGAP